MSCRRSVEDTLNSFPNYKLKIGKTDLHFLALFSEKPDAVPLLLLHGWPGIYLSRPLMVDPCYSNEAGLTSIFADPLRFDPGIHPSSFAHEDTILPKRPSIPSHRSVPTWVWILFGSAIAA